MGSIDRQPFVRPAQPAEAVTEFDADRGSGALHWWIFPQGPEVTASHRMILTELAFRSGHDYVVRLTEQDLVEATQFTARTVRRKLAELEDLGLIEIGAGQIHLRPAGREVQP